MNYIKKNILSAFLFLMMLSCSQGNMELINLVNTQIGTASNTTASAGLFGRSTEEYGQTLPAVFSPNGMNFWTAQTQETEEKCKAPYYYKDTKIQGFRNSHWIVGGCTQDYGSMTLMPVSGQLKCLPEERASQYSHDKEISTPAYYSVFLEGDSIQAELTATSRSAIFRFTYKKGKPYLVVNPNSDFGKGFIEIDTDKKQIRGYNPVHRIYQGWGEPTGYSGYFVVEYQDEIEDFGVYHNDSVYPKRESIDGGVNIGAYIKLKETESNAFLVKAASSFTDMAGAINNLKTELPHWNFDKTRSDLSDIWENRLSKIEVETDNKEDKIEFYSAFYRASFLPHAFNDCDGRYPSFAKGKPIKKMAEGKTYYEDYSMWDTYRAVHPLINILEPEKSGDMVQSLLNKYEQGGWLPIFPCWNSYTAAMIGDHCVSVIADAYIKGVRNFDTKLACEAMLKNAFCTPSTREEYVNGMGRRALDSYIKYGYIPLEDKVLDAFHQEEQVSRTLEYAYDDFAVSQMLKDFRNVSDYDSLYCKLLSRSKNYQHVIDPSTGYCQGRYANGEFSTDKGNSFSFSKFITEGAPCHYTWYVPHDVYGLMDCMGGKENYVSKLDSMFSERRYWHGNEPCHQVAYMFNYAGQPWKTQREVKRILETEYHVGPGGLSGNDDAGQMSAWFMFTAMGFYPVCPASPYYIIGSPVFPFLKINLENGNTFTIIAHHVNNDNIYIQSAKLNGHTYDKNYLSHDDIMNGGTLEFVMGNKPNMKWGSQKSSLPPALLE